MAKWMTTDFSRDRTSMAHTILILRIMPRRGALRIESDAKIPFLSFVHSTIWGRNLQLQPLHSEKVLTYKISIIHLLPSRLTSTITDTVMDGGRKTYALLPRCVVINDQCTQSLGSHRCMCFDPLASPLLVLAVGSSF